jgi:hypothetical protein
MAFTHYAHIVSRHDLGYTALALTFLDSSVFILILFDFFDDEHWHDVHFDTLRWLLDYATTAHRNNANILPAKHFLKNRHPKKMPYITNYWGWLGLNILFTYSAATIQHTKFISRLPASYCLLKCTYLMLTLYRNKKHSQNWTASQKITLS